MKRLSVIFILLSLLLSCTVEEIVHVEEVPEEPEVVKDDNYNYPDADGRYSFKISFEGIDVPDTKGGWTDDGVSDGKFRFDRYDEIKIWDKLNSEFVLFYVEDEAPWTQPVQIWSAVRDTIPRQFTVAYYPAEIAVDGNPDTVNLPSEVTYSADNYWTYYAFKAQVSEDDVAPDRILRFKSLLSYIKVVLFNPPMEVMHKTMKDPGDGENFPVWDYTLNTSKRINGYLDVKGTGLYYAEAKDDGAGSVTVKGVPYRAEYNTIVIYFPVPAGTYTFWMDITDNASELGGGVVDNIISQPKKNNYTVERGKLYVMNNVEFGMLVTFKNTVSSWNGSRTVTVSQITRSYNDLTDSYSASDLGETLTFDSPKKAKYAGDSNYSAVSSIDGDLNITEYIVLPPVSEKGWLGDKNGVKIEYFNNGTSVSGTERVFMVNGHHDASTAAGRTSERLRIRNRYYDFTLYPSDNWDSGSSHDDWTMRFNYYFVWDDFINSGWHFAHLWRPVKFFFIDETGWGTDLSLHYGGFNWEDKTFYTDLDTTTGDDAFCNPHFYPFRVRDIDGINYKWSLMYDGHLDLIHKPEWASRGGNYDAVRYHRALKYNVGGRTGFGDEMDGDSGSRTPDNWLEVFRQGNYAAGHVDIKGEANMNYVHDQYFRLKSDNTYEWVFGYLSYGAHPTSPHPNDQEMSKMYPVDTWYYYEFQSNCEWINDVEMRGNIKKSAGEGWPTNTDNFLIGRMDRDRIGRLSSTGGTNYRPQTYSADAKVNDN